MQYSSVILAALAATGVIARPSPATKDIVILLQEQTIGNVPVFPALRGKTDVKNDAKFQTVTIAITGQTDKLTRCSIFDKAGKPLTITRGDNKNKVSFGMGNGKPWTIDVPGVIDNIKCGDEAAKEPAASPAKIARIQIDNNGPTAGEDAIQREIKLGEAFPIASAKDILTVSLLEPTTGVKCVFKDAAGKELTSFDATKGAQPPVTATSVTCN